MSAHAPVPDEIRKELTIHATRQQVWAALTEPEQLKRWFPTHDATVELRPGRRYALPGHFRHLGSFRCAQRLQHLQLHL